MDPHEKYLYDLQGYITVPDALDADQLRRLNEEVDRHIEAECPSDMTTHRFFDTIDWGGPLLELIDNPRVRPYLDATIGEDAYRLDHVYLDVIRSGKGPDRNEAARGRSSNPVPAVLPVRGRPYVERPVGRRIQPARRGADGRRIRSRTRLAQEQLSLPR